MARAIVSFAWRPACNATVENKMDIDCPVNCYFAGTDGHDRFYDRHPKCPLLPNTEIAIDGD